MTPMLSKRATAAGAALGAILLAGSGWYGLRHNGTRSAGIPESASLATPSAKEEPASFRRGVESVRQRDYAAAALAFQQVEAQLPSLPGADFYVAEVAEHQGRGADAEAAAARYVARSPDDIAGAKLLAHIQMSLGHPDRAVATLTSAVGAGRIDIEALELLGRAYAKAGDAERATRSFDRAAVLAPDDSRIQIELASARLGLPDTHDIADLAPAGQSPAERLDGAEAAVYSALGAGDIDRAKSALEALRHVRGGEPAADILAGAVKAAQSDYAGARAAFVAALGRAPASVRARLNLARLDMLEGRPDEARTRLAEALHTDPTDMPALQASIALLLTRNDIQQAIGLLDTARAAAPANPLFTIMLADLVLRFGDGRKALAIIDAAPKEFAALPAMMSARARALVAVGNANEARDTYARILAREPANPEARSGMIELLLARNDTDGAAALLRNDLRAGTGRLATLEAIVRVEFRARGTAGAAAMADRLAADPANLPLARVLKGDMYMSGQHYPEAVAAYADQVRTAPSDTLQARLALALDASGLGDQAVALLRTWIAAHPDDAETLMALASLDLNGRRTDDAIGHLSAVLKRQPNNAAALNDLAWAYQLKGDPRARDLARKAYAVAPTAEIADTLGWIIAAGGQPAVAVPLLREASAAMPGNATALYHYATALNGAGLPHDAARVVGVALAQPANFPERRAAGLLQSELSRKP